MTAEIAILNKLAIALATDSAVTISSGDEQHKTYDSADKLFDLSHRNPLGIMIFNGLQFMQTPLPMLILQYRSLGREFAEVTEAAQDFLEYLREWGNTSPEEVQIASLSAIIKPMLDTLEQRIMDRIQRTVSANPADTELLEKVKGIPDEEIAVFERVMGARPRAEFIGGPVRLTRQRKEQIREIVGELWSLGRLDRVAKLCEVCLQADFTAQNHTGIVVSGFGSGDIFPTLVSFNIDGMVFGKLKFAPTNHVDIDRRGDRARVIPFAQKEMVDRFLYGLDQNIERQIAAFCRENIPEISRRLIGKLDMEEADKETLLKLAAEAESAFVDDLKQKEFERIRSGSREAIEGLVEFMPKPEMARMAEALVNLTSLKRRVSRGMDTVGGPIDVAVISRSDGFVWVKRKHYFSTDLNPRYLYKLRAQAEVQHGRNA